MRLLCADDTKVRWPARRNHATVLLLRAREHRMAVRLSLVMTLAAGIALFAVASAPAQSPPAAKPEMRENCPGLVASRAPRAIPAAFQHSALKATRPGQFSRIS